MTTTDAPPGLQPTGRTAPGTAADELQRLALQERADPSCDPLKVQAMSWLFRGCSAVTAALSDELRPLRLSPSAFNVLLALHNTPDRTLEPCQLAERLLISRPSVTGLLDTLQRKGLVRRRPHADDGRRILVELTDAAGELLATHFPVHHAEQERTFEDLTDDELAQLVSLLRRIRGPRPEPCTDRA